MLNYTSNSAKKKHSFLAVMLSVYFMIIICDVFNVGNIGTILKLYAIALVAFVVVNIRNLKVQVDSIFVLEILFVLISLFTLSYSIHYESSLTVFVALLLNFSLVILYESIPFSMEDVKWLEKSLVIGGVVVMIGTMLFADYSLDNRLTLTIFDDTLDQNFLNGYTMIVFSFFVYRFFNCAKQKLLSIVAVVLVLLFTLMTGSRGALLAEFAIVVVLLFMCTVKGDKRRKVILASAVLFLLFVLFYDQLLALLPKSVAQRFTVDYIREEGTTGRLDIWKALIDRFINDDWFTILFGKGMGTSSFYNVYDDHMAHNILIEVLIGGGIVGLSVYTALISLVLMRAYKSKNFVGFATLMGLLVLGMSISLLSYKPIFNIILYIEIYYRADLHLKKTKSEAIAS